ncbi:MAG: TPM domain-containing protein [Rhodocyclaceae bacterium]|nr:TPM domain-containing protein [Rhodocyclaceae bacterium]
MDFARLFKHLMIPGWWARRAFRAADRAAIHEAIAASERLHRGELCLVVEGPMPLRVSLRGTSARGRAEQLFSRFGVGGTREASGILIYVQLVDRRVEILADRGIAGRVAQAEWDRICRAMEASFAQGAWRRGVLEAIDRATRLLSLHFPARRDNPNELDDRPRIL